MPAFAIVSDPLSPGRSGRIRYDRRRVATAMSGTPLVLIGGMTQTIQSWSGHLRPLSASREVLAYETRGQGATELDISDCSIPRHVEDFVELLGALEIAPPVDVCGFSFGARVALAIAATHPTHVRKLALTGLALGRSALGRVIVRGWQAALRTGDLEALAWVSLADILGPDYLEKNAELVDSMVRTTAARNRYEAIAALLSHTMDANANADTGMQPAALAPMVDCPCLVMGGELDRLAPPREVAALAELLHAEHERFPSTGHTVPIEASAAWRDRLEAFLNAPTTT